jgi:predicted Zn-dependent protease
LLIRSRAYVQRLDGVVFGADPQQGWFEGTHFVHPQLAFEMTFPAGWQTQNSRASVAAGAPDRSGVVQLTIADAKDASPVQYVQQLALDKKIASFEGQRETIGGFAAWTGHVGIVRNDGTTGTLVAAFVRDNASMFQVLGQSTASEAPLFETIRSFRAVTDRARLDVKPARVKIVTVPKSGTFADVVAGFGPQQIAIDPESILNNVEPGETVAQGTLLKLVPRVAR